MKPVNQTILNSENGDCMRACVASVLEWPLNSVPNFMEDGPDHFNDRLDEWAGKHGITILDVRIEDEAAFLRAFRNTYLIAFGQSPRFDCNHAVVYKGNKMVHDPHPSKEGIKDLQGVSLFVISDYRKYFFRQQEIQCKGCNYEDAWPGCPQGDACNLKKYN